MRTSKISIFSEKVALQSSARSDEARAVNSRRTDNGPLFTGPGPFHPPIRKGPGYEVADVIEERKTTVVRNLHT